MFEPQGLKIMIDLHGLSVKEVKKLLEEHFLKIQQHNIGEFYLITGRGNHINSNGSRGVLKKILPNLLKPYCQDILKVNREMGAYKIILKPKQELNRLKNLLINLYFNENECIKFAKILQKKAERNDIESLLVLAKIHLHQAIKGFDNINEGIALLQKATQAGSLDAEVELGILYHEGLIVKQRHEKAFKHFLSAAKKDHPLGQYYVAVCYLHGKGVKYNDKQAVNWMKKSADQNDIYAQDALGDFYLMGEITKQNKPLGIDYKTKAAEQGCAEAQIDLAKCYATGYGVEKNYQTAFNYYLAAAQSNKPYAVYQVGSYLFNGRTGLPPDLTTAFDWFLKAAELNDGDGQAQVAYQYLLGVGIKQNLEKGIEWVSKAIKQENTYGYYVMALAYLKGLGVTQDGLKAYNYMELAAKGGYADAQYKLGILLFEGKTFFNNLPKNFDEGLQWLEKAMTQGNHDAAEIVQFIFKKHHDSNMFSKMLRDKMQVLLAIPEVTHIASKPSTAMSNDNSDNSLIMQKNAEKNFQKSNFLENKGKTASVAIVHSSSSTSSKAVQKPSDPLENEFSRLMTHGKELENNDIDFYMLGELGYMLTTISWYMTGKEYKKHFCQMHAHLYDEFTKRANLLGAKEPEKKVKETLPIYVLRYIVNVGDVLAERTGSPLVFYFNIGFKMMTIKMMEFSIDGDQFDIVKELLDYLSHLHNHSPLVDIPCIKKIEQTLNEQLKKPKREFTSKEFVAKFKLLEDELKLQLFQENTVKEPTETQLDELDDNFFTINQASSSVKEHPSNLIRHSIWSNKTLTVGVAATAIGIAVVQREEIADGVKTICNLQ